MEFLPLTLAHNAFQIYWLETQLGNHSCPFDLRYLCQSHYFSLNCGLYSHHLTRFLK